MSSHLVVPVMGTMFSLDLRDEHAGDDLAAALAGYWRRVDEVFSTYKNGSDVSRLDRGEIGLDAADPDVAVVLRLCARAAERTSGYFSVRAAGRLDPSGLVKGWSVEQAARKLRLAGVSSFSINGGGDVRVLGEPERGRPWSVGIADPRRPGTLLTAVAGRDLAVATSGTAERGAHVISPFTGRAATELASVTVTGPSLVWADAYATAAMAMGGERARAWLEELPGYEALLVSEDGETWCTGGFPAETQPLSIPA